MRELEGAIIINSTISLTRRSNIELAKSVVENLLKNVKREISIDYIQKNCF
jgi:chromosomal replication initiator protein